MSNYVVIIRQKRNRYREGSVMAPSSQLCLPLMNLWTWLHAPLFSTYSFFFFFFKCFVSRACSQSLKYEWVSVWGFRGLRVLFSLPCSSEILQSGWALLLKKELRALWDCLSQTAAQLLHMLIFMVTAAHYLHIFSPRPPDFGRTAFFFS